MRIVYHLNGKSFQGLEEYKRIPLDTLKLMADIHLEAVEAEKKTWEKK